MKIQSPHQVTHQPEVAAVAAALNLRMLLHQVIHQQAAEAEVAASCSHVTDGFLTRQ